MEILVSEFPIPRKSVKGKSCTHTCWETAELRNTHIYVYMHRNVWRAGLFALLSTYVLLSGPYRMVSEGQEW